MEIRLDVMQEYVRTFDPGLTVFHVEIHWSDPKQSSLGSEWRETFGSEGELRGFLRGFQAALSLQGYFGTSLGWNRSSTWGDGGLRWTIIKGGMCIPETLDADRNVVTI